MLIQCCCWLKQTKMFSRIHTGADWAPVLLLLMLLLTKTCVQCTWKAFLQNCLRCCLREQHPTRSVCPVPLPSTCTPLSGDDLTDKKENTNRNSNAPSTWWHSDKIHLSEKVHSFEPGKTCPWTLTLNIISAKMLTREDLPTDLTLNLDLKIKLDLKLTSNLTLT